MEKINTLNRNDTEYNTVLVIDENGTQLGNFDIEIAKNLALKKDLDLVLVSSEKEIPVCKIMDYDKYKFDQEKKAKKLKKKQKDVVVKEIQLSFNIDKHDFETKVSHARKFLSKGNRVNVVLRLKGRENVFGDKAMETASRFFDECSDISKISKPITRDGNNIFFLMLPL